jgi:CRISPR-associated protein Cas2
VPGGFLIAYDITSPRRLGRMHRYLASVATPIEYSVFFVDADVRAVLSILAEASALIDTASDDLRCYPLPARGMRARLGMATLPAGIHYSALPATWSAIA